jgi:hypothetical protein
VVAKDEISSFAATFLLGIRISIVQMKIIVT